MPASEPELEPLTIAVAAVSTDGDDEFNLDGVGESMLRELKRRVEEEPESIPGTVFFKAVQFFIAREERKAAEDAARREEAARSASRDDLDLIRDAEGLPSERRIRLAMQLARAQRADLSRTEKYIQELEQEDH